MTEQLNNSNNPPLALGHTQMQFSGPQKGEKEKSWHTYGIWVNAGAHSRAC